MKYYKKMAMCMAMASFTLGACSNTPDLIESPVEEVKSTEEVSSTLFSDYVQDSSALTFDNQLWNYDNENDVYWQINVVYGSSVETLDYETMGIYVPGAYMTGVLNDDGTYTCSVNLEASINGYSAETAPIVFPVNTAGYSAQAAPTSYSYNGMSDYLEAGFIYVYAGMRGRNNGYDEAGELSYSGGAPWGVTDLKAAIRYYRFNDALLPGDTDRIFTLGHSGGGAQSALMGATGDSELYYEYLMSIGAAMVDQEGAYISDAIAGAMAWCPITSLDYADAAYEWNMGQYVTVGTRSEETWTSALSDDLAEAYAAYINNLGLMNEDGENLLLEASDNGIYAEGTYYDYVLSVIEESLNHFISDTEFPYTATTGMIKGDAGFAGGGDDSSGNRFGKGEGRPEGAMPDGDLPEGTIPDGALPEGTMPDGVFPSDDLAGGSFPEGSMTDTSNAVIYETVQDYIDSLNSDVTWVKYDEQTQTVSMTSIEDFITHCKTASKDVGAFDDLNRTQAENKLFGNDESDSLHFDSVLSKILQENSDIYATYADWDASILYDYLTDLTALDKFGTSISIRQNMYNPMYFISSYYEGYESANVAKYWRIHSGIEQGDTALTTELNLALALQQYDGVESVEFETVWGQGHTTAERVGNSTENFINWVNECLEK